MVHVARMFAMIHAGGMRVITYVVPTITIIPMIAVAPENAAAGREQDEDAEKEQVEFHKFVCRICFMRTGRTKCSAATMKFSPF